MPLTIKLADIGQGGLTVDETLPVSWVTEQVGGGVPVYAGAAEARIRATLERVRPADGNSSVQVSGAVSTRVTTECSRCLAPVIVGVDEPLRALVVEGNAQDDDAAAMADAGPFGSSDEATDEATIQQWIAESQRAAEATSGSADIYYFDGVTVDLGDIVRETIALALPMVPRCRADCLGLCQKCGADLNEGVCGCEPDRPLSPFAALASFKKKS